MQNAKVEMNKLLDNSIKVANKNESKRVYCTAY